MHIYKIMMCVAAGIIVGLALSCWKPHPFLNFASMMAVFLVAFELFGFHSIGLLVSVGGWLILLAVGLIYWAISLALLHSRENVRQRI